MDGYSLDELDSLFCQGLEIVSTDGRLAGDSYIVSIYTIYIPNCPDPRRRHRRV